MTMITRLAGPLAALAIGVLAIAPATAADPHAGHGKATATKSAPKPAAAKVGKASKPTAKAVHAAHAGAKAHAMHAMMRRPHGQGHSAEHRKHMMSMMTAHHGGEGHGKMKMQGMMHDQGKMARCGGG